MNIQRNYFVLIAFILCSLSCKKSEKKGNYMTCKVNGEEWSYGGKPHVVFDNDMQCFWRNGGKLFYISASRNVDNADIDLSLFDSTKALASGTYELSGNNAGSFSYRNYSKSYDIVYNADLVNKAYVIITFDAENKRVKGSFSARCKSNKGDDIVEITDGEFSLPCEVRDN